MVDQFNKTIAEYVLYDSTGIGILRTELCYFHQCVRAHVEYVHLGCEPH